MRERENGREKNSKNIIDAEVREVNKEKTTISKIRPPFLSHAITSMTTRNECSFNAASNLIKERKKLRKRGRERKSLRM